MQGLFRAVLRTFFHLLATLRVDGLEQIPERGPFLMATNHIAFLDAPLEYALLVRHPFAGWAAEKYERHLFYGPLLRIGGSIFIRRGEVHRGALDAALEALRRGWVFGLAPEGTRSPNASLIRGRTGVAYLAYYGHVPVLPVAVTGTERVGADLGRLRRPRFTVRVGHPFSLPALDHDPRPEDLRRGADEVMCRIAVLLPPVYRGVYADHARTHELLAEEEATRERQSPTPTRPSGP